MGFFKKLFDNRTTQTAADVTSTPADSSNISILDKDEIALVSAVTLSIAAGDKPTSEFIIKKIEKNSSLGADSLCIKDVAGGMLSNLLYAMFSEQGKEFLARREDPFYDVPLQTVKAQTSF